MANRQFAPAESRTDGRENTARVVMHKSTLPGWFWGMLGCFSVLGVGFVVLIFVAKNGFLDGGAVAPGTASAAAALAPVAAPAATPHAGPQIEQMDRSAAAAVVPSVAPSRVPSTAPAAPDQAGALTIWRAFHDQGVRCRRQSCRRQGVLRRRAFRQGGGFRQGRRFGGGQEAGRQGRRR